MKNIQDLLLRLGDHHVNHKIEESICKSYKFPKTRESNRLGQDMLANEKAL